MSMATLLEVLEFVREKTLATVDAVAKLPDPAKALGWRPGPGRAHLAWQLMHLGATDDRHLHVRMKQGEPKRADYVQRFAGGSTPDDNIPSLDEIRRYLDEERQALLAHWRTIPDAALDTKPHEQAPWTYRQWVKVLAWHEAHHQGQAHLTLNLFKATHGLGA
ncbi:MAG: DinB family protein [Gemmataceae bacterium]